MNDKVEERYTQMFAPQPIPQSVIDLYKRAKFLSDRVDAPMIPLSGLVIIAALATKNATTSLSKQFETEEVDTKEVSETLPAQTDEGLQDKAPETPVEQQTAEQAPDAPIGNTGPMDAPQGAPTEAGKNSLPVTLNLMSKAELIAHATGVCRMTMRKVVGRKKKGKVTKTDIQTARRSEIIEKILGAKNG